MGAAEVLKPKRATYQDVLNAPPNRVAELIAGELSIMPRPRPRHANASSNLLGSLYTPFRMGGSDGPGGWIIYEEPELHFGDSADPDVLVPDLAGWRRERFTEFPETAYIEIAPDWVCEVLSPATASYDRKQKLPIYLREDVSHVWLVDPDLRTLEAFEKQGKHYALLSVHQGDEKVRVPPFDAVELNLAPLWSL